jgi:NAD(P)-dependent dehydrogenase (short-subunit alcohol dehydrogenase family)
MAGKRVWFITGAGRGMGVDIAQAALADGHGVVATGRNTEAVADAVGEADDLLVVELDITSLASAEAAVQAALERFGRIDVLVNNAGNFYAGFFEELTPEQIERSLTTNLVGPMNVTRAVLPVMRKQRSGNVVTITSTAGIVGQQFCSAYAAAKFGLRGGWSRCGSRSSRSASTPRSLSRASSALSCSKRSQRPSPMCRSTTTPSAPPRPGPPGRR